MVFKNICVRLLWTKVASALEGLAGLMNCLIYTQSQSHIIGCFSEVQLAIRSVGICGSDLKLYKYGKCGRFTLTKPMVAGHEASGVVSKLGEGVAHLKVGKQTYRNLIKI